MLARHRAKPTPRSEREVHRAAAIIRYREWDAQMKALHGPLYYRAMQFPIH